MWATLQKKRWPLMILLVLSVSTVGMILVRSTFDSCSVSGKRCSREKEDNSDIKIQSVSGSLNPLEFMKSKLVLLVSHELSLSGGPLLLMELAFLLRGVESEVVWITNQKPVEEDEVIKVLEHKMLDRGVQVQI
jgi:hypothetical protein